MNLRELVDQLESARDAQDEWCSVEKAHALAAIVIATRPELVVEIGVWRGASLIPQLLALRHLGVGRAIAIDPWHVDASVDGEVPINVEWWSRVNHEIPFAEFRARIEHLGIASLCEIWRKRSDDCDPPDGIGILHIDGNHSEQAYRDVARFAPHVKRGGGFLVMDDLAWAGGGVSRGHELAKQLGFVDRYELTPGIVMQRT